MKIKDVIEINGKFYPHERNMTPEEEAEYNNSIPNIPQEPTQEDRIEAQVLYTALMTDTLLEE